MVTIVSVGNRKEDSQTNRIAAIVNSMTRMNVATLWLGLPAAESAVFKPLHVWILQVMVVLCMPFLTFVLPAGNERNFQIF